MPISSAPKSRKRSGPAVAPGVLNDTGTADGSVVTVPALDPFADGLGIAPSAGPSPGRVPLKNTKTQEIAQEIAEMTRI